MDTNRSDQIRQDITQLILHQARAKYPAADKDIIKKHKISTQRYYILKREIKNLFVKRLDKG